MKKDDYMKARGFELVIDNHRKFEDVKLPLRGSKTSAGYDFYSNNEMVRLKPDEEYIFWTDVKAYMLSDEVLKIYIRSSSAIKHGLVLKNQVGIIDSDYYSNVKNDGNIGICIKNNANYHYADIFKSDRIAQGIFIKYLESDNCNSIKDRVGGIGSTNK